MGFRDTRRRTHIRVIPECIVDLLLSPYTMNSVSLGLLSRDVHDLTPIVNEGPGRLSYDGCPETIIPGRNCGFCHLPNYLEDQ